MSREVAFWGWEYFEYGNIIVQRSKLLKFRKKDEAIKCLLDESKITNGEITICGFAKKEYDEESLESDTERIVESLIDAWFEDYADEEETKITQEMIDLGREFVNKMMKIHGIHQFEVVYSEEINVKSWIKKNK